MSYLARGRTLYFSPEYTDRMGVDVSYHRSSKSLWIGGWFDGSVGIEAQEIPLGEFLRLLKIPKKDVVAVLSERGKKGADEMKCEYCIRGNVIRVMTLDGPALQCLQCGRLAVAPLVQPRVKTP